MDCSSPYPTCSTPSRKPWTHRPHHIHRGDTPSHYPLRGTPPIGNHIHCIDTHHCRQPHPRTHLHTIPPPLHIMSNL